MSISTVAAETSTAAASEQTAAPVAKPAAAKKAAVKKARTGKGNLAAGVYFIVSKLSKSKVVSIAKKLKKNGSNAVLWSIIGDGNQQWRVIIGKDGYATLKNVKTGKVLTVADKSKDSGTSVVQWKAKKKLGKAQKWIIKKKGSKIRAKNVTGTSLKKLRKYLDAGCPVVVWTTIGMGSPGGVQAVRSGYPLRSNNHAVVLTGYNPKNGKYQVADSLAGVKWRSGKAFNRLYKAMGKQAVVLMD